jgi:hypothetical protein
MSLIKPLINGHMYQFSSIVLTVNGVPFDAVTAVNYESTNESSMFYGTSKTPIAQTKGNVSHTGSITIPADRRDALLALVTHGGTKGWADSPFVVTVSYAEEGEPMTTDVLDGVRLTKIGHAHSQGNEPLSIDLELSVPTIVYGNGLFRAFTDAV